MSVEKWNESGRVWEEDHGLLDAEQVTKSNLMIFIRTTIIRDNQQLAGATAEKYSFIRDKQVQQHDKGLMYLDDGSLPLLPEWEEQLKQLDTIKASGAATSFDDAGTQAPVVYGQ